MGGGAYGEKGVGLAHSYQDIISLDNLLEGWREFLRGKRQRKDMQQFKLDLMENIFLLHRELTEFSYHHGSYHPFSISDPKPRRIYKASVRDRLLHHAIYRVLYPFFDRTFVADSFSCRLNKGTHRALNRFRRFAYQVSHNHTRTVWVLKCDIRKFFANIDHQILKNILAKYIPDQTILWLLGAVIDSFSPGLPLGNLTAQLFVNIYMNEFDQWVKHTLKIKHYIRYADDFVIISNNRDHLCNLIPIIQGFLRTQLKLTLHPNKISIQSIASGVDFLGWVHFPDYRVLRTVTKRRMKRKLVNAKPETVQSYLGSLKHGNTAKIKLQLFSNG